ncbi:MAG: hypothetical protein Q9220_005613 [cf. Caloplaca sp. 1 TL-2023]
MPATLVPSRESIQRNLPRHSSNGGSKRRAASVHSQSPSARLSIIEEDGDVPPMPPKAHHRPFHRRWNLGDPPRISFETSPPKYSVWDATGPKGEKLSDVRNNKHIARRGGWRRICLIALLVVTLIVALVMGLVFGLQKKNSSKSSQPQSSGVASSPSAENTTDPFPAGSYTLITYLDNVQTACTSKPQDFSCYPSHTYAESPSEAMANFTWIITRENGGFVVSSANNPWSVNFDSTPLTILDVGSDEERYQFNTSLDIQTIPDLGVSCFFNNTNLEGNLYTKKTQNYPVSGTATSSAAAASDSATRNDFGAWPYAVDIRQSVGGGQNTPECFRMDNGQQGDRITEGLTPQSSSSMCSCEWKNFSS